MNSLQWITDQISERLERAVYVEDGSYRPLVNSAQIGRIDDARVKALLDRSVTEEHFRYFVDSGVSAAMEPLRVPASTEHGLLARVVVPVTSGSHVLARVWLIDSPRLEEDDLAWILEASAGMRPYLFDRNEQARRRTEADGQVLREILHAGQDRREDLFRRLYDDHHGSVAQQARACVLQFTPSSPDPGRGAPEPVAPVQPAEILDTLVALLESHKVAGYQRGDELLMLVSPRRPDASVLEPVSGAARRAALLHRVGLDAIGLGGALHSADGVGVSARQAAYAARVARRVGGSNGEACWDTLGEYRLFADVGWDLDGVASLHEGAAALVADHRTPLAATLLAYLEREGDVGVTAEALNVHRTTLYYRIKRAREVLGEDPAGSARFGIHAALRLAELAGLCTPPPRGPAGQVR
ncbi:helix-turn-helix domain-containing protein [Nocardiopsis sp. HNM0947]|uniref:Helix-turn-helix domain-containing protein n=1 Tax=Nocardiopsis coralli TaxID=2772213 RepID=A0ABR9PDP0_9ACTN|nr:helix-turn-helix domain-containing protein [Nocardiopsis coralli]MBE3001939.1 helix-turn-helix domain-containing protein [Nocardiopsis coralli]